MENDSLDEAFAQAVRRHESGDLSGAEAAYRAILARDSRHAQALHFLGVLDHQRGQHEAALAAISQAISLDATRALFHNNRGVVLRALGQLDDALSAYREALRLRPHYADAHSNLGAVLHHLRRYDDADASLEEAVRLQPAHVDGLFNLANLRRDQGNLDTAVALYRRALALAPDRADLWNNLGSALVSSEKLDEAIEAFRKAVALNPNSTEAVVNLAQSLARQDRVDEAIEYYRLASRLEPNDPRWALGMASVCPVVFSARDAIERYRARLESTLDAYQGARLAWDREDPGHCGGIPSFNLAHHGCDDRRIRSKFAGLYEAPAAPRRAVSNVGVPTIGFVVTHCHEGIFLRCVAGLLNQLTPGRFRPIVLGSVHGMEMLRKEIAHPDVTFVGFPDQFAAAAETIESARCDVLYYWEVGTDPLNYFLPFARLAPVQCTSWGMQITTGLPAIDDYVSSALVETPDADAHYSETLVRLSSLLSYQERSPRPDSPVDRAEFGLPERAHLYVCLQRPQKLHPDFDAILAEILRRDRAGLVILLKGGGDEIAARLTARFRETMPDVIGRIALFPILRRNRYLRLLSLADVVLDPFHYGAGSSCYDIFSYDLPLVTFPGPYNASRYAQACYRRMGLAELVTGSAQDYVLNAVQLGTDQAFRASWAARIAAATPRFFEDKEVIREHERFFQEATAKARCST